MKSLLLYKSNSLLCSKYEILIKYTLVPSIFLSIIAILSTNPDTWRASEIHHFYIELIAVILAAVLAFYYLLRAHTLNDKFSLFVGLGFLTSTLIDLLHVTVSYFAIDNPIFLKYFIPQTWFAGRIFLSSMLAMAIVKYSTLSRSSKGEEGQDPTKLRKNVMVYLVVLAVLATSVAISSLFLVLPASVVDDYSIHRPYEIPPLVLFTVALFYFYKNQLYKRNDAFYKGILGYLIVDIFAQIIMSYSTQSFDTAHNVAHVLKDAGYFINIIALALSGVQYNADLKESNERLRQTNDRLKEREELICIQYDKLKEADKMKNEFINIAAHELRTPIQPILGLTGVLRSRTKDAQQQELLDVTIRNARRLQQLTEDILDVTKIGSQSLNLKNESFNLNDIITNTIDDITTNTVTSQKSYQRNAIKLVYLPHHIFIQADKARITQVISNLLGNAVKFTEAKATKRGNDGDREEEEEEEKVGGIISIKAEKVDGHALVTVKDSGSGIDPSIMPRLFEKFISKSYKGTGLGLYISKSIVEAHGGKIWAENNTDAKGATFTFSLPVKKSSGSLKFDMQS